MNKRLWVLLWSVLLSAIPAFTSNATAQERAPSDDELHCMYCVEVLKTQITLQQHLIAASSDAAGAAQPELRAQWIDTSAELLKRLAKLEGALYTLQLYLLPRIPALDSRALASAIRQADADIDDSRAISVTCTGECPEAAQVQYQAPAAHSSPWNGAALLVRLRGCETPTWLSP